MDEVWWNFRMVGIIDDGAPVNSVTRLLVTVSGW